MASLINTAGRNILRSINQSGAKISWAADRLQAYLTLSAYTRSNRRPWSTGYYEFRARYFREKFNDLSILAALRAGDQLPKGYGWRLDCRVVEIPWVLARISDKALNMLDAGSSFNSSEVLDSRAMQNKQLTIMTLGPEHAAYWQKGVSYVYGDLRDTYFRDNSFDAVVCISTIEHVGMDNTRYAAHSDNARRAGTDEFAKAILEFKRVLKPEGVVYITLPFGRYEDHGWLQQFDAPLLDRLITCFEPRMQREFVYQYMPDGWVPSSRMNAADCQFFDVQKSKYFDHQSQITYPADYAAGERAVACLELYK